MRRLTSREQERRTISLGHEAYEVSKIPQTFGPPRFAVEAVTDDGRAWLRSFTEPGPANAMRVALDQARGWLETAWLIADDPEGFAERLRLGAEQR